MKEQFQEDIEEDSTPSESEEKLTTIASEEEEEEEKSSIEVMGIRLIPLDENQDVQVVEEVETQEQPQGHEEVDTRTTTRTRGDDRRGVDAIRHKIELKPGSHPRAQKLQRLGVVKEEALLKEIRKLLSTVIANGPFEKWGIDAMGPLPRTANGKLYILVAIDYMTRWVEAQSVAKVNEKTVSKFVYTHICCRLGTPLEIVSNNGPGFERGLLTKVCEELKISHRHSTPYYPQSNGLVEKANGIIAGIIRKMVESKPKRWDNFLDGAIWAYRTTYRDATQFTPFHLVYGQEALQPIELNIPTIKLTGRQEQNNDEAWIDKTPQLGGVRVEKRSSIPLLQKKALQLKDKVNEGIKDKEIKEKSLVLRYNNALDNRFDAKFERRWEGPFIVKKAFTGGYYQLMELNGKEHPRKVNGYRLKPYLSRILPAVFETKQVSKKTKKVCCHCCSGTHQVKSCAFQHVLHEVAKNQKEKLSSPTSYPESSFQYDPVDGT
ncbi:hypothetical protein L7F22_023549 [Adiantum nelumboides]|nr:hypothetical protein [Adiantum nelumboides]